MKKHLYIAIATALLQYPLQDAIAQMPSFPTKEYVEVNNIRASALLQGDLWSDHSPMGISHACEFPKNSGRHIMMASGLWMAGYDNGGALHVSAQTYRQSGNDYWPGPLNIAGNTDLNTINQWAKIWKVNKSDITDFMTIADRTIDNVPKIILDWPAKGNPHAKGNGNKAINVQTDMAPFVDVNKDGKYNALDGDYPALKGDQMLWWVFNDNGIAHDHSTNNSLPLKVEIKATAYAFKNNTAADNMIFYEYEVSNKSTYNYAHYRLGLWVDADMGYPLDDYIGFDSSHRMGIAYNGNKEDGFGEPDSYGAQIPTAGVTLIETPGDSKNNKVPAGGFMYYNNDNSVIGNPNKDSNFNNYLRAMLLNGDPFTNDFSGKGNPSRGMGAGPITKYVYTGDPADTTKWSECVSGNIPGDRRFIITSNDFTFNSGSVEKLVFALVVTNPVPGYDCTDGFGEIKKLADSAWDIHKTLPSLSVQKPIDIASSQLKIYPSPARETLYIETATVSPTMETIKVLDNLGRTITIPNGYKNGKYEFDIRNLPAGMYHVLYNAGDKQYNSKFVKE